MQKITAVVVLLLRARTFQGASHANASPASLVMGSSVKIATRVHVNMDSSEVRANLRLHRKKEVHYSKGSLVRIRAGKT